MSFESSLQIVNRAAVNDDGKAKWDGMQVSQKRNVLRKKKLMETYLYISDWNKMNTYNLF